MNTPSQYGSPELQDMILANLIKPKFLWECNKCGSQEYTMSVSCDDVQDLGCGNCGGNEWHKAEEKE